MVSIALKPGQNFDPEEFSAYVTSNLPGFAQPVFVRIQADISTTGTFKLVNGALRKQSFHLDQVGDDAVYVMLPRESHYQALDSEIYSAVMNGTAGY